MRAAILGLPEQLRWASAATPPEVPSGSGPVVVCGLGGSAMAGDVARLVGEAAGTPIVVHRSYGLPPWAAQGSLVLLVSYSGGTEEVHSAADAVAAAGLPAAVVASGGVLADRAAAAGWPMLAVPGNMQPRAALGYQAGAALRLLEAAGRIPGQAVPLREAAAVVEGGFGGGNGEWVRSAAAIAALLVGRVAIVVGTEGPAAVAARRWKTQINENAKQPAYHQAIPELDHNEIEGWSGEPAGALGLVLLRDADEDPRQARRAGLTRALAERDLHVAGEVRAPRGGLLARLFGLIGIGDLVSVALADLQGVDPTPVGRIQEFKRRLAEE